MGRFWVFFLSHTAPGFQWWFCFHLCTWVVHWGLLLSLPWRTGCAPVRTRCQGGAAAWVAGALAAPGTQGGWQLGEQEIQCSRRYGSQYWPIRPVFLPGEPPLWQRSLAGHRLRGCKESDKACSDSAPIDVRFLKNFFCLWQLCPCEGWAGRWCSCLACGDPGGAKCAGTRTGSAAGVMVQSESFFKPLVAGDQKTSLASLSS